jgi:protein involved in polysaccharide export with SLBB domain
MVVASMLVVTICSSCRHVARDPLTNPVNEGNDTIQVTVRGWVQSPGFYRLAGDATLDSATRACGGWVVRSDIERLRQVRIIRLSGGQTNELRIPISQEQPKKVILRDGDELVYEAVLW